MLPEEKINTWEQAIVITNNAKSLLKIEIFSIKNLSITETTNNPAMALKADKTVPDRISK